MRNLLLVVVLALSGCSCERLAADARLIREGAEILHASCGVAQVRSLSTSERANLDAARDQLVRHARALERAATD